MIQIEENSSHGYTNSRQAGLISSNKPIEYQTIPWQIVIQQTDAPGANAFRTVLNSQIDHVREIILEGVAAADPAQRMLVIADASYNLCEETRIHTSRATPLYGVFLVQPGQNVGRYVLRSWRDSKGYIPRNLTVTQLALDGVTPLAVADRSLTLYFRVTVARFQ